MFCHESSITTSVADSSLSFELSFFQAEKITLLHWFVLHFSPPFSLAILDKF
jgi:hypothetical protein